MKQLKFSEEKVLKTLLDKTKTTTLRKTWKLANDLADYDLLDDEQKKDAQKPCKYKVGEIVELIWTGELKGEVCKVTQVLDGHIPIFGRAKITKIEKIAIKGNRIADIGIIPGSDVEWEDDLIFNLSKSEGFKNPEDMFAFLEKYSGGLKEPRDFYLISFEWLE